MEGTCPVPRPTYDKYLDAMYVELENWMSWGGIRPLSRQEGDKVMNDPSLRRIVLRSRPTYKDKNRGIGEVKAKCRVVLIGCNDPDIFSLTQDAPTPTRLREALVMAIAAAGAFNRKMCGDGCRWSLWISDAKSAFLQGEHNREERAGPLYMLAPCDPLIIETGCFASQVYEVLGNGYGFPDSPRVWHKRVHQRATERNFRKHGFDKCMYYYIN